MPTNVHIRPSTIRYFIYAYQCSHPALNDTLLYMCLPMFTFSPQRYAARYRISHINTFGNKREREQTITHLLVLFIKTTLKCDNANTSGLFYNDIFIVYGVHNLAAVNALSRQLSPRMKITSVPYATTESNKFQVDKETIGF